MNNTNGLISSDNKGYASHMMEKRMNPGAQPHEVKFVAAFAQANEGDVSPNTRGPHCLNNGKSCDNPHSTCDGKVFDKWIYPFNYAYMAYSDYTKLNSGLFTVSST